MKQPLQKRQDWIRGRREKRKLARQARLRRQVLRYTLLALLVASGLCGLAYLPWTVRDAKADIIIHGNRVASDEQIRSSLLSAVGQPVFKLDPAKLEASVCSLPVIKYAFVRRSAFPHPQVRVEVLEEFPWATISRAPDVEPDTVISQSGRLIPIKDFPKVVEPPLRICANSDLKLSPVEIAQWDAWVRLISAQLGHPVDVVDLRQPTRIAVTCGDVVLHLGQADSTLTRRLNRIASVMPVAMVLKDNLKYIDLSLDSNIPLKVDRSATGTAKDDELLRQAVRALASNP